jgi:hypothetical protein
MAGMWFGTFVSIMAPRKQREREKWAGPSIPPQMTYIPSTNTIEYLLEILVKEFKIF